ncbi:MAG: hypothetical protein U0031_06230 [Thermomicrobiales bacterium]
MPQRIARNSVALLSRRTALRLGAGGLAAVAWTLSGTPPDAPVAAQDASPVVRADDGAPAASPILGEIVAVATGGGHFLALRADGTVWSWGTNSDWELGVTTPDLIVSTPVQVTGLTTVQALATGDDHGLALKADGTVWAWGKNNHGQLGVATETCPIHHRPCSQIPILVAGLPTITTIAATADSSFAVDADGMVWAWGDNRFGQLGTGTPLDSPAPVRIEGLTDITTLSATQDHTLALRADGTVWEWGDRESASLVPVNVAGLADVMSIAADQTRNLALKQDGTVWTWSQGEAESLAAVTGFGPVHLLAGGGVWSAVVDRDGMVWLWIGQTEPPSQISNLRDVAVIAMGSDSNLAIKADGTVWTWSAFADPAPVPMSQPAGTPGP